MCIVGTYTNVTVGRKEGISQIEKVTAKIKKIKKREKRERKFTELKRIVLGILISYLPLWASGLVGLQQCTTHTHLTSFSGSKKSALPGVGSWGWGRGVNLA